MIINFGISNRLWYYNFVSVWYNYRITATRLLYYTHRYSSYGRVRTVLLQLLLVITYYLMRSPFNNSESGNLSMRGHQGSYIIVVIIFFFFTIFVRQLTISSKQIGTTRNLYFFFFLLIVHSYGCSLENRDQTIGFVSFSKGDIVVKQELICRIFFYFWYHFNLYTYIYINDLKVETSLVYYKRDATSREIPRWFHVVYNMHQRVPYFLLMFFFFLPTQYVLCTTNSSTLQRSQVNASGCSNYIIYSRSIFSLVKAELARITADLSNTVIIAYYSALKIASYFVMFCSYNFI